jgi:hypothetical protein
MVAWFSPFGVYGDGFVSQLFASGIYFWGISAGLRFLLPPPVPAISAYKAAAKTSFTPYLGQDGRGPQLWITAHELRDVPLKRRSPSNAEH